MAAPGSRQDVQDLRDEVMRLLERHRVLTSLASRQQTPRHELLEQMQHRQNLVELQRHLRAQHPADIAVVLDSLSGDDRRLVFGQLDPAQAGAALVESSDAVRASLIEELGRDELVRALGTLDADDLAFLSGEIPDDVMEEVSQALAAQDRSWLKDAQHHDEDSVGRLMTQDVVVVRERKRSPKFWRTCGPGRFPIKPIGCLSSTRGRSSGARCRCTCWCEATQRLRSGI